MEPMLTATQYLIFVNFSSIIAILGGLLLWTGFIMAGLVSRRFEHAFGVTTHWLLLMVSPVGAVIYLVMQSVASLQHENMGPVELWTGYTMLLWSAILCVWGANKFHRLFKRLEKELS